MQWPSSLDLNELGTLPSVLLIGLLLIVIFGGIGLLRRVLASVFNVAYSVAMVGAVYLSVAILSDQVPAPENWLTFLLLTVCLGLMLNYEPVGAPILGTIRWALLIVTIPVLTYFILFELILPDSAINLEVQLVISVASLIALFLLAFSARWFIGRIRNSPTMPSGNDSQMTQPPERTVLLADKAREPQPAMLPALVIGENAYICSKPGAQPIRGLSQGRQVVVIARDPTGQWLRLRHSETLWIQRSMLQIQGDPSYLRELPG